VLETHSLTPPVKITGPGTLGHPVNLVMGIEPP
jgi:hypothetical protein